MIDPVDMAIVIVYFLILVGIGVVASKKIHTMNDYVLAGRSLGFWLFTMLMIGSVCSGMSLLGVSGLGYSYGWPTIWEQIFVPLSQGAGSQPFLPGKLFNMAHQFAVVIHLDARAIGPESPQISGRTCAR